MKVSAPLIAICCLLLHVNPLSAQVIEAQTKALRAISVFAEETCGNRIAMEGGSTKVELSGDVKAQLQGLIAQVADIGITGAGKYKSDAYRNVLHEQLTDALKNNAICKLKVFELLYEKMIPQH